MYFPLLISTIAGLSTCIGVLFTYIKPKNINRLICISLSFTFGIMVLLSIKELIPIPLKYILNNIDYPVNFIILIIIPIIAYFILKITNKYKNINNLYRIGVVNALILLIHNIPEGIITFISSISNSKLGLKLCLGIIAHNIPEGISISLPIYYSTKNRGKAILYTFISGIVEPLGGLIIYILFNKYINLLIINGLLYFIGILMILISFINILNEIIIYNNIIWFLIGILLSLFILII